MDVTLQDADGTRIVQKGNKVTRAALVDLSPAVTTAILEVSTKAEQTAQTAVLTAIAGYVDGLEGIDYAKEVTLAALLAKVIAAPSTEAKQDAEIVLLAAIQAAVEQVGVDRYPNSSLFIAKQTFTGATLGDTIQNITIIDTTTSAVVTDIWRNKTTGLDLGSAPSIGVDVEYLAASGLTYGQLLTAGLASQTTLADVLAKLIVAPSTEAKQDTLIAKDFATQTTLAALLDKVSAAPSTEAKQDTLIAKDFATQTTLAAVLAKLIVAPSTEAKQDALIAKDFATQTTLAAVLAKLIANLPYTDISGTIAVGGTAQTVLTASAAHTGVLLQNISDTDMYVNTTGTATAGAGSYLIKSGGVYETPKGVKDVGLISLLCATTGKAFTAKWW